MLNKFLLNAAWLLGTQIAVVGLIFSPLVQGDSKMVGAAFCTAIAATSVGFVLCGLRKATTVTYGIATGAMLAVFVGPFIVETELGQSLRDAQEAGLAWLLFAGCVAFDLAFLATLLVFGREPRPQTG